MQFAQALLNGLSLGTIYALLALGYTMVYGILKLINFAHGDVYMFGAYAALYTATWFGLANQNPWLATVVTFAGAMTAAGLLGFVIERFAYRPLRAQPRINSLIVAIGISLFLQYGGQLVFSPDPRAFPTFFPLVTYDLGGFTISNIQVVTFCIALLLMAALHLIIQHTKTGTAMRAVSNNILVAELMGIPTNRIISFTFVLGSMLAAAAGVLIGFTYPAINPLMGTLFGIKAFVAAVLGGIGSVPGAVLGGILMGVVEVLFSTYGTSTYRDALAFVILILVLLVRPAGLLGRYQPEKV